MLRRYRATGADLPFTDLRRAHDAGLEGYFWRFSHPPSGRVVVALCGVCRDGAGATWATVALAGHPSGFQRQADVGVAAAATDRFSVSAGPAGAVLSADGDGDGDRLSVDLGSDARLDVRLTERREWTRPPLGGVGIAHLVPGLGQYWHPYLFGAKVTGTAVVGEETLSLEDWEVYAERNWGGGGFPPRWWWGQAQGFGDRDVCVAFAGGDVTVGPARMQATSVIVALGNRLLRLGNPLLAPVHVEADGSRWLLQGRGPRWSVELEGDAPAQDAHRLPVPLPLERRSVPGALEHLGARVRLVVRHRGRVTYAGESMLAGLEIGGLEAAGPDGRLTGEGGAGG